MWHRGNARSYHRVGVYIPDSTCGQRHLIFSLSASAVGSSAAQISTLLLTVFFPKASTVAAPDKINTDSGTNKSSLGRLRTHSLEELSAQFDWSEPAESFLTARATFETVLQSLINHGYWFDAASMLAHALPQRESVWWAAAVCDEYMVRVQLEEPSREQQAAVLKLARAWVGDPVDEQRMTVYEAASSIPNRMPAHWVGMAVFWSMGNITPDAGIVTLPPPHLYARGVSAAIDLAASLSIAEREPFYEESLGRGIDIASGGDGTKIAKL